ncbi:MAG: hypothetical protein NW217_09270 [Hyphomicrobiaceae bacterium]|nr:hypothetical protein [Hyphomicrobiaceae bacterium]
MQARRIARTLSSGFLTAALLTGCVRVAHALEPDADEKAKLEACEVRLCDVVLDKAPARGLMACDIAKTWNRTKIEDGASAKTLKWGFGDARCSVAVRLDNAGIVAALTAPSYELQAAPHQVSCQVETDDGVRPVTARLKPKLKFEGGKVRKIWIGLETIEGPSSITALVRSAAFLEDSLGLFHKDMVRQVNKFVHEKCAKSRIERARQERLAKVKEIRRQRAAAAARRKEAAMKRRAEALRHQAVTPDANAPAAGVAAHGPQRDTSTAPTGTAGAATDPAPNAGAGPKTSPGKP